MKHLVLPIIFALCTALCWGFYGPTLGKARAPGVYTAFKPYLGIGLAYLVIAIIGGSIAMKLMGDDFSFAGKQRQAIQWGFLAGCLGALGALGLTAALVFASGKVQLVMPIIFGGAVSVNAIVSAIIYRHETSPSPWMWVGTAGVVVSAVVVAMNIPHAPKKPAPAPTTQAPTEAESERATT